MAKRTPSTAMHAPNQGLGERIGKDFQRNKYKYLLVLPVLIYLVLFAYKPMYGLVIAFKQYRPARGIWGSNNVGFLHFKAFFTNPYFWRLLRNTFTISLLNILFAFPAPILLALLLNEVYNTKLKRTVQTITYMPYFISLVVACSIIKTYSQSDGIFSQIAVAFGGQPQNFLTNTDTFLPIYILSDVWQTIGWNSIIYMAALSGISPELYEAARIDGANRFKQVLHVTLPGILPTIMILLILRMGSILNVGYEKILLLYTTPVYEVADVISTYVYRQGIEGGKYSYATAVGLFNSVVNVIFLLVFNAISRKFTESSLF